MGALRRLQLQEVESGPKRGAETPPSPPRGAWPRWAVISGLIAYCAVFWVLIVVAASAGIELAAAALAAGR